MYLFCIGNTIHSFCSNENRKLFVPNFGFVILQTERKWNKKPICKNNLLILPFTHLRQLIWWIVNRKHSYLSDKTKNTHFIENRWCQKSKPKHSWHQFHRFFIYLLFLSRFANLLFALFVYCRMPFHLQFSFIPLRLETLGLTSSSIFFEWNLTLKCSSKKKNNKKQLLFMLSLLSETDELLILECFLHCKLPSYFITE